MRDSETVMLGLDSFIENKPTYIGNSMSLSDFVFCHFLLNFLCRKPVMISDPSLMILLKSIEVTKFAGIKKD